MLKAIVRVWVYNNRILHKPLHWMWISGHCFCFSFLFTIFFSFLRFLSAVRFQFSLLLLCSVVLFLFKLLLLITPYFRSIMSSRMQPQEPFRFRLFVIFGSSSPPFTNSMRLAKCLKAFFVGNSTFIRSFRSFVRSFTFVHSYTERLGSLSTIPLSFLPFRSWAMAFSQYMRSGFSPIYLRQNQSDRFDLHFITYFIYTAAMPDQNFIDVTHIPFHSILSSLFAGNFEPVCANTRTHTRSYSQKSFSNWQTFHC